jgi:hypothetical protein
LCAGLALLLLHVLFFSFYFYFPMAGRARAACKDRAHRLGPCDRVASDRAGAAPRGFGSFSGSLSAGRRRRRLDGGGSQGFVFVGFVAAARRRRRAVALLRT